jgi:NADP-dependent 3-hydroxy acid dehydrogenase YdfG
VTEGSVALVTGASSGIGQATVRHLVRRGFRVAALARRTDRLEALAAEVDGAVLPITADVTDEKQARAAISRAVDDFGGLDVLINNAGIMLLGPFETNPPEDWRMMFELNVIALMTLSHEAIPHLRTAASGPRGIADIINVGSLAGRSARPHFAAYNASKWAVTAFTEALRQELAPDGIRVSVVQPGAVDTELLGHVDAGYREKLAAGSLSSIKYITAVDVADTIEYLATLDPTVAINELVVRFARQPF